MIIPNRDIQRSIVLSIKRNGIIITMSILNQYIALKKSQNYRFFRTKLLPSPLYLRSNNSDFSVFRQIFMNGEYDISVPFSPKIIIDAGANIGLASLYFSQRFPTSSIYALEPDPENFHLLSKHARLQPQWNIFQLALWDRCTTLTFTDIHAEAWGKQVGVSQNLLGPKVLTTDIATFMKENNIEIIDVLKIDIEGSEFEVFNNNYEYWLNRTRMLIVELHENVCPGVENVFNHALKSISYRRYCSGENEVVINQNLL